MPGSRGHRCGRSGTLPPVPAGKEIAQHDDIFAIVMIFFHLLIHVPSVLAARTHAPPAYLTILDE